MRIALQCRSLLLQQTLYLWLQAYMTDEQYDLIISDVPMDSDKPLFIIGYHTAQYNKQEPIKNLYMPFTKEVLVDSLEQFYQYHCGLANHQQDQTQDQTQDRTDKQNQAQNKDQAIEQEQLIEQEVEALLKSYTKKLSTLLRQYHSQ